MVNAKIVSGWMCSNCNEIYYKKDTFAPRERAEECCKIKHLPKTNLKEVYMFGIGIFPLCKKHNVRHKKYKPYRSCEYD